jgi:hypothetical protein
MIASFALFASLDTEDSGGRDTADIAVVPICERDVRPLPTRIICDNVDQL